MAVPWREVDAEFKAVLAACRSQFSHHITLAILIRRVPDRVICVFRWPQAEAVMVLGSENDGGHSGGFKRTCPLLAIEFGGVEDARRRVAISPFLP